MNDEEEPKLIEFIVETWVKNKWRPLYSMTNLGKVFTNPDTRDRRIVDKTRNLWALLPPGTHRYDQLRWRKK